MRKNPICNSERMSIAVGSVNRWLWLVAITVGAKGFSLYQPSYRIPKPTADYHVIASELSHGHSLAIAHVQRYTDPSRDVKVYVAIIGENSRTHSQCLVKLTPDGNATSVGITSLKRLTAKKLLLVVYDTFENVASKMKLVHVDLQDCKITALKLPKEHFIVTYQNSDKFDILVSDRRVCKSASARCRISYDGLNDTVKPFDIDLDWKSLRVEYTPSRDFLISGFDTTGVYKFILLDRSFGTRRDLLVIPNAKNMDIMSSQFSVCYIEKPQEDKIVHCSVFDEDGESVFQRTVTYREPVILVSVQSLITNRTLVLVGKAKCDDDWDCWNLFVTQVQPEMKIWSTRYTEHFDCSGDRKNLVFSARQNDVDVVAEYVCDNGKNFTYKNYIIDTTDQ